MFGFAPIFGVIDFLYSLLFSDILQNVECFEESSSILFTKNDFNFFLKGYNSGLLCLAQLLNKQEKK